MLKRILILLILALAGTSCTATEEEGGFRPYPPTSESRKEFERLKREFLQIEDLKRGDGPIAAWGRKITADKAPFSSIREWTLASPFTIACEKPAHSICSKLESCWVSMEWLSVGSA